MDDAGLEEARPRPDRTKVRIVVVVVATLFVASIAGDLLTTTLADTHPLTLIALNSRNRILVLTTNDLDAVSYYGVATLRLLVSDPLFFLLGVWYGDAAIRWVERKWASQGELLRWVEKGFSKASYPLVFLAPNNYICLFAGAAGMSIPVFFVLNVAGTIARLYAIRVFGATFDAPIQDVLDFFSRYRLPLLAVSIVFVGLSLALDRRRGGGDLEVIKELEEELEELDDLDSDVEQEVDDE